MKYIMSILATIVLSGCASTEPWQKVREFPVCRHKVAAWVEGSRHHNLQAEQVWFVQDSGAGHAVVRINQPNGEYFYLDVKDSGFAYPVELSESEEESIFWRNRKYNNGESVRITR